MGKMDTRKKGNAPLPPAASRDIFAGYLSAEESEKFLLKMQKKVDESKKKGKSRNVDCEIV